jgi:hypothetical protein
MGARLEAGRGTMPPMTRVLGVALTIALLTACGGHPPAPKRGVAETAIAGWEFGRFQEMLDVEVWVPENKGVSYAGSYVKGAAARAGRLGDDEVVSVIVTRYTKDDGVLRATVKFLRRLAQEAGYDVEEDKIEGVRLVKIAGNGELWAMWAAKGHVVKVGGRNRTGVPGDLIGWYGARYPSAMPSGALEGPLPAGHDEPAAAPDGPRDPDAPDWEGYDPKKVTPPVVKKKGD